MSKNIFFNSGKITESFFTGLSTLNYEEFGEIAMIFGSMREWQEAIFPGCKYMKVKRNWVLDDCIE